MEKDGFQASGAFMGIYEDNAMPEIVITKKIGVLCLEALLHYYHSQKKICYTTGMTHEEFYNENKFFLTGLFIEFKKKRDYDLRNIQREAIKGFFDRMEFINKSI